MKTLTDPLNFCDVSELGRACCDLGRLDAVSGEQKTRVSGHGEGVLAMVVAENRE